MMKKAIVVLLIVLNVYAFAAAGRDNMNALNGGTRTAEVQLVAVSSLGAAPGMLLGFKVFNHKTNYRNKGYLQDAIYLVLFQNIILYSLLLVLFRKKNENRWLDRYLVRSRC